MQPLLPTNRDLLKGQILLPSQNRQHMVLIQFLEPIEARGINEFFRIGLFPVQLAAGESDRGEETFYQAEIFQPHRAGIRKCSGCGGINERESVAVSICRNAKCELFRRKVQDGPVRGVIDVSAPADMLIDGGEVPLRTRKGRIVGTRRRTLTRGALLVLDRRYPQEVLAAVFRSAHELAELKGWKIKG